MAIIRVPSPSPSPTDEESLQLIINNGDLMALKAAVRKLGFKDEESLLRYALAVFTKSATRTLVVMDTSGQRLPLSPAEQLLTPKGESEPEQK